MNRFISSFRGYVIFVIFRLLLFGIFFIFLCVENCVIVVGGNGGEVGKYSRFRGFRVSEKFLF